MPDLTLAILAAGSSVRFGRPKALEPVGPDGEVLFEYAVCDAIRSGCRRVVFVAPPDRTEALTARAAAHVGRDVPVDFVVQDPHDLPVGAPPASGRSKPWGTGHAVLTLRERIAEPFLVANADDFYGPRAVESFGRQASEALAQGDTDHLVASWELGRTGVAADRGVSRGILDIGRGSTLLGIDEVRDVRRVGAGFVGRDGSGAGRRLAPDARCSMNLWAFDPSIFDLLEAAFGAFLGRLQEPLRDEFLLSEAVGNLARQRLTRVCAVPMAQRTAGITHPGDLPVVAATLRRCVEGGALPASLARRNDRRPA